ncbi:MAG: hypothetical protein Athens071425_137 [Parcubacteria group bacterium Athens0714_25]|nr:MAG: hypothetical protein Athens071425_137 [Parcubacteria group bacterium Athens0714_25]
MKLITPKYLTEEDARKAVEAVLGAVMGDSSLLRPLLKRVQCHIVILVPGMKDDREADYPDWPNYPLQAVSLYEHSLGKEEGWEHPYDNIARCKALQLWTDRNDDRTMPIPHLLFSDDTPYWGGVKRRGIVVTCSGVQPWFDKMISGMIADVIVGLAHNAYENDEERKAGVDFLS